MRILFTLLAVAVLCLTVNAQTETINLDASVFFASASHEPDANELAQLEAFASQLTGYADYTLRIEAFTDEQGTDAYNEALAQRRAAAITSALAQNNVTPTSSVVLTYGEQQARMNTTDDLERQNDRRVDLVATVVRWTDAQAAIDAARAGLRQSVKLDDPTVRQTVIGNKGGIFMIEPNTLVLEDGTPATGPVTVELVEAYDLSDMLLAGLSTTSDGRRLETGGMVEITAKDLNGNTLQLKNGKNLTASIPTGTYNEGMQIFSGTDHAEDGTPTNWALTPRSVSRTPQDMIPPKMKNYTYEQFREKMERIFDNYGENFSRKTDYRAALSDEMDTPTGRTYVNWLRATPAPDAPAYIDPAGYRVHKKPVLEDTSAIVFEPSGMDKLLMSKKKKDGFTTDRRRQALNVYNRRLKRHEKSQAYFDNIPSMNEQNKLAYKAEMDEWKAELEKRKLQAIEKTSREAFAIEEARYDAYEKYRQLKIEALETKLAESTDLTGMSASVNRYFFTITELGWANCDMFMNEPERIEVFANLKSSTPDAKVMLLPTDRRSVIAYRPATAEGQWKNTGIPRGIGYHVIAYQVVNGQLVMAHKFVDSAEQNTVTELAYQPVAVTELKTKMAALVGS